MRVTFCDQCQMWKERMEKVNFSPEVEANEEGFSIDLNHCPYCGATMNRVVAIERPTSAYKEDLKKEEK